MPIDDSSLLCTTISKIKKYRNKDLVTTLQKINDTENLEKEIESKKRIYHQLGIDNQRRLKINSQYSHDLVRKHYCWSL
jgi:hypothetical protein